MRCKKGDKAHIVNGIFGHNVGIGVVVGDYMGEHSKYGPIWHVRSLGCELITEYGVKGMELDVPDAWLRPIPPTVPPEKMISAPAPRPPAPPARIDERELLAA